ncbi:hypothetical protein GCM10020227_10040 [Streptomyces flavovirens]
MDEAVDEREGSAGGGGIHVFSNIATDRPRNSKSRGRHRLTHQVTPGPTRTNTLGGTRPSSRRDDRYCPGRAQAVIRGVIVISASALARTGYAERHQAGFSQKASTLLPSGSRTKAA